MTRRTGLLLQVLVFAGAAFAFGGAFLDSWWFLIGVVVAVAAYTPIAIAYLTQKEHTK